ncbi:MAG: flippase-like domain-containing protein [Enterococcus sp.]|nr:flippase-like domain-containing protein [Enterococcus sp.]
MKSLVLSKDFLKGILFTSFIALVLYYLWPSFGDIFLELKEISFILLLLVSLLGILYQYFEGQMVKETVHSFTKEFSAFDGMFASCYSAFYRVVTFGAGTIFAEINFYHRKKIPVSQGVGVAIFRFMLFKTAALSIAILGLIFHFTYFYQMSSQMVWFTLLAIIVNFLINGILMMTALNTKLQVLLVRFSHHFAKGEKARKFVDQTNLQINGLRKTLKGVLKDKERLCFIYFWSIVKALTWFILPYLCLIGDHPDLSLVKSIILISFVTVLSGIIPSPAGIGSFEFVYLLIFRPYVGTVDAASSLLLYRFASFILPFLIGLIYVIVTKKEVIKNHH